MIKSNFTFARYEEKYLLDKSDYKRVRDFLESSAVPDDFGEYIVKNNYFDTRNFDIIRQSIQEPKPLFKEKLRLRYYGEGLPADESVFLELKKKFDGIVYKRRIMLKVEEAMRFIRNPADVALPDEHRQVADEIANFLGNFPPLVNRVPISYRRTALSGENGLRVTFDTEVKYDGKHDLLEKDCILMEIKTDSAMPLSLARFLSENEIFPCGFSKYKIAYQKYIFGVVQNGFKQHNKQYSHGS
ncbi:MAG: polyphosphate polymerase domain-containing protein [Oscillospiraceae bacterium]|nr:polyphosphate polymerase domain-containing protein [Oscillospiraceae bacterium]